MPIILESKDDENLLTSKAHAELMQRRLSKASVDKMNLKTKHSTSSLLDANNQFRNSQNSSLAKITTEKSNKEIQIEFAK